MFSRKLLLIVGLLLLVGVVAAQCAQPQVQEVQKVEEAQPTEAVQQAQVAETQEVKEEPTVVEVQQPSESRLEAVRKRGKLICGGNANLAGFGYLAEDGTFSGFDIDFCRALAVAIFGVADDTTLEIRPLTASDRPIALQTNEIDVLIRNTTYTLSRDTEWAANFGPTTFYDGQGMMVRKDSGIKTLEDLEGGSVCVQTGTTTELNLADQMAARGINYEPKVFPDAPSTLAAYQAGNCDGFTTDKSGLISQKQELEHPEDHVILDVTMSKEPLGPAYAHGDDQWADIVDWTVYCTISAEEYGVTSENVDDMVANSNDPVVKRMLGVEGDLGKGLGLDNDFCVKIIRAVGNYEEIYNRNLGPDTPFNVPRGLNSLWTEGGLLYSPPFR
ncbi:MAG: amino acid ABC transporter substrate-binding protein [Caldilineae bacterium]|nr:MAG: amino acid ABC transporter substrate-binding protein [Caldilineae bacterium]